MKMRISEIAALAGVSVRTLQYYDAIGLLKPSGTDGNGYRIYDENSVEQLKATPHNYRPSGFVGACLQIFRHFCQKLLEIRQYSCVVFGNLTKNLTAQSLDNNCAVLP